MITRRTLLRAGAAGLVAAGSSLGVASAVVPDRWQRLRRSLAGDLVLPADAGYDQARKLDSAAFDAIRPQALAYCESSRDVQTCLAFAQDERLPAAVRSGGHSAAGWSTSTGLVLDVSRLNAVDVGRSTVTLGPGAQGVDVLGALAPHGLSAVSGNCPTVCAGGYLQGGGVGPLARKHGVASDRLVSAQVVLADGRTVTCSAAQEPELFWALRGGGGGNVGVVTRFEIVPVPVTRVAGYTLVFPWARAAEVIGAYLPWVQRAPDDLFANLTVIGATAPGAPPSVVVTGGLDGGPPAVLNPLLDELVAAAATAPLSRAVDDLPYHDALMRLFNCATKTEAECHRVGYSPEATLARQSFVLARGRLLDGGLSAAAIGEALAAFEADPVDGQFRVLSLGGLGGRINRVAPGATAYVHRSAQHSFTYTAGLRAPNPTAEATAAVRSWVDRGFAVADRYGDGGSQVNFVDPALRDWRSAYYGANYGRLVAAKRRYDPAGFFRFPQAVGT